MLFTEANPLVSLDGSTLGVADDKENERAFGRPAASRGQSAYPRMRFVLRVENGTHVLFGKRMAGSATGGGPVPKTRLAQASAVSG
ncbi:MAG TPA: hypothetical protein VMX16_01055 [Terriglobia bacterium]|nr:hypothetical protein [Terriglobia bacterium]